MCVSGGENSERYLSVTCPRCKHVLIIPYTVSRGERRLEAAPVCRKCWASLETIIGEFFNSK